MRSAVVEVPTELIDIVRSVTVHDERKGRRTHFADEMRKPGILRLYANAKADSSKCEFDQLKYFAITNWKKLKTLKIQSDE